MIYAEKHIIEWNKICDKYQRSLLKKSEKLFVWEYYKRKEDFYIKAVTNIYISGIRNTPRYDKREFSLCA